MGLFGPRCEHQWEEVHRDAQPPMKGLQFKGFEPEWFENALFGCTHVELCCRKCGDIKSRTLRGEHPSRRRA